MSVRLEGVALVYPNGYRAFGGIDFSIAPGERVAIIGPSGAGKSTLLKLMAAALRPSGGTVEVLGAAPWRLDRGALRRLRSRIGMVHQAPPIPPRQRAVTAVLAGRLGRWSMWKGLASLAYPADRAGARAVLERMEIADKLYERCDRLSGGQLQRVGVARVLYQEPDLLLADEPVSAVDPALSERIISELDREATTRRVTLVASLHAVDLALRWFPRIIGLRSGEIAFDLPAGQVSEDMLRELYVSEQTLPVQDSRLSAVNMAAIKRQRTCS